MNKDGTVDQFELKSFVEGIMNKDYSVVITSIGEEAEEERVDDETTEEPTIDEDIELTNAD